MKSKYIRVLNQRLTNKGVFKGMKSQRTRKDIHNMAKTIRVHIGTDSTVQQYAKPNMTNLPADLGRKIFKQIQSTKAPDYSKMCRKADRLEKQIALELERVNSGKQP